MSEIKLWYSPGACSLAPHILLEEIGTKYEAIQINVMKGFPEEHRHLNPKMKVPILSFDGEIITEVPAIMTLVSQQAPEKKLFGSTNLETVRVYEWLNYLSGTLHAQSFGGLFRPARFSDDESMHDAIRAKALKNIETVLNQIEENLKGIHAVGNGFTAADAFLLVFYLWSSSPRVGFDMKTKYPKYTALADEVKKRESVGAALKAEGLQ